MTPLMDSQRYAIPFTFRQLECFVSVAETQSLSRAAENLRLSDSAVSDAVSALEKSINRQLLIRRRAKGVTLTSDGLSFLQYARDLLTSATEAHRSVSHIDADVRGVVRIGAISTLAPTVLPKLIHRSAELYPLLDIDIVTADLPELLKMLENALVDVVLCFDIGVPPEAHRHTLASTQACVVVSENDPLARLDIVDLREVQSRPMILLDISPSHIHTLELMSSRGVIPNIVRRVQDYELCRALVARGLGYTLLMQKDVSPETWDGSRVVFVPISPVPRRVDILFLARTKTPGNRVKTIIDLAVLEFGGDHSNSGEKKKNRE